MRIEIQHLINQNSEFRQFCKYTNNIQKQPLKKIMKFQFSKEQTHQSNQLIHYKNVRMKPSIIIWLYCNGKNFVFKFIKVSHRFMIMSFEWKLQGCEYPLKHFAIDSPVQFRQTTMQFQLSSFRNMQNQANCYQQIGTKNYFPDKSQNSTMIYAGLASQILGVTRKSNGQFCSSKSKIVDQDKFLNLLFYKKQGTFESQYLKGAKMMANTVIIFPTNTPQKYEIFFIASNGIITRKISNTKIKKEKSDIKEKICNYMSKRDCLHFVFFTSQNYIPEDFGIFLAHRKPSTKFAQNQYQQDDNIQQQYEDNYNQQQQQKILTLIKFQQLSTKNISENIFEKDKSSTLYKLDNLCKNISNKHTIYVRESQNKIIISNKTIKEDNLLNLRRHCRQFIIRNNFIKNTLWKNMKNKQQVYQQNQYISGLFAMNYNWLLVNRDLNVSNQEIQQIKISLIKRFYSDYESHKQMLSQRIKRVNNHYPQITKKCKFCLVCKKEKQDQQSDSKKMPKKSGYRCQGCSYRFGIDIPLCLNNCFKKFHKDASYYMIDMSGYSGSDNPMLQKKLHNIEQDINVEQQVQNLGQLKQTQQIIGLWDELKNNVKERLLNFEITLKSNNPTNETQKILNVNQAILKYNSYVNEVNFKKAQIKQQSDKT